MSQNTHNTIDCNHRERNEKSCPCKSVNCQNHGKCCDCIANHRESKSLVACMRFAPK